MRISERFKVSKNTPLFVFLLTILSFMISPLYVSLVEASASYSPVNVDLSISPVPELGETAEITAVINYIAPIRKNQPQIYAEIILPKGFELIEGNTQWNGQLREKSEFTITVRAIEKGDWTIEGFARMPPTGESYFGHKDFIYISVGEDGSTIYESPFPKPLRQCPLGEQCTSSNFFVYDWVVTYGFVFLSGLFIILVYALKKRKEV